MLRPAGTMLVQPVVFFFKRHGGKENQKGHLGTLDIDNYY